MTDEPHDRRPQDLEDLQEPVEIIPYVNGPYLVRGPVQMRDQSGGRLTLTRRPIALCRCGRSQTRPFCDGTHQLIDFRAPSEPEGAATSATMLDADDSPGAHPRRSAPPPDAHARRLVAAALALLDASGDDSRGQAAAGLHAVLRELDDVR